MKRENKNFFVFWKNIKFNKNKKIIKNLKINIIIEY